MVAVNNDKEAGFDAAYAGPISLPPLDGDSPQAQEDHQSDLRAMFAQDLYGDIPQSPDEITVRRVTLKLDEPTRDGDTELHLLTNLPKKVSASKIAVAYASRWQIETAFHFRSNSFR